jgi:disulfide bond formation protein DsbB
MAIFRALTPRRLLAAIGLSALGLVAVGFVLGEWLALNPCPLCIFQRLLYLLLAALALAAAALFARQAARRVLAGLAFVTALGGMATAIFQTWLQAQPVSPFECGVGDPNLIEQLVDWLGRLWPAMFLATGSCSSKEWVFLGLSMAGWSIVCFGALALLLVPFLRRRSG